MLSGDPEREERSAGDEAALSRAGKDKEEGEEDENEEEEEDMDVAVKELEEDIPLTKSGYSVSPAYPPIKVLLSIPFSLPPSLVILSLSISGPPCPLRRSQNWLPARVC